MTCGASWPATGCAVTARRFRSSPSAWASATRAPSSARFSAGLASLRPRIGTNSAAQTEVRSRTQRTGSLKLPYSAKLREKRRPHYDLRDAAVDQRRDDAAVPSPGRLQQVAL